MLNSDPKKSTDPLKQEEKPPVSLPSSNNTSPPLSQNSSSAFHRHDFGPFGCGCPKNLNPDGSNPYGFSGR